ncbi:sigma-E factor negative regulatory protein, partial [Thermomonas flagellata]|uniref:sigma-E factor negative regulatory protein n=1 Tax=Thermomonas flagellata TaxID=2888524 RepID=UPI0023D90EB2
MSHDHDPDHRSSDLTRLSSREQLSALMDGALPRDATRFLLRRLQHDAELAACWERWRIAGEALRGSAPGHRLPPDFAARVAAAVQGAPRPAAVRRRPGWRW